MAEIIEHPSCGLESETFVLEEGAVIISANKGEKLTLSKMLFLLDLVRQHILRSALED